MVQILCRRLLIKEKHGDCKTIAYYFDSNHAAEVAALNKAYKERLLSKLIIMNGNINDYQKEMLNSQQILGTKPFNIT